MGQVPVESVKRPYPVQTSQSVPVGPSFVSGQYPQSVSVSTPDFSWFSSYPSTVQSASPSFVSNVPYPGQVPVPSQGPSVQKFESVNQQSIQSQSPLPSKVGHDQRPNFPSFVRDPSFSPRPQVSQVSDSSADVSPQQTVKRVPESNLHAPPQVPSWGPFSFNVVAGSYPVSSPAPSAKPTSELPAASVTVDTKVNSQSSSVQSTSDSSSVNQSAPSVSAGSVGVENTQTAAAAAPAAAEQSVKGQDQGQITAAAPVSVAQATKGQSAAPQSGYLRPSINSVPVFTPSQSHGQAPSMVSSWSQSHYSQASYPYIQSVQSAQPVQSAPPQFVDSQSHYSSPHYSPYYQGNQLAAYPYNFGFAPARSFAVNTVHGKS